ncbi:carbonic anhydrase [Catalinimonas alkaloidigena]|uniref:SulP family inorganic anion transporter n=1 Tax=Catalinimonas alkaloidigena TaxID=1075417 RepID=UPI002406B025|nr:SulP family inorganic anion transporter [Catalinimonas alkaloidigena]MDF9797430.1 carbonic anhydrase [Catalinimonas alkaloidigena]
MTTINLDEAPPKGWKGLVHFWKNDLVAAVSVALVALPLGLGIAVAAGAPPMSGLISVVVGGIVTTFIRGSHVGINGPANALIVVALVAAENLSLPGESGYPYAMGAFVIAGGIQIIMGFFKLGKLANLAPSGAIHGMLAAIGIIILGTQIHTVLGVESDTNSTIEIFMSIPENIIHLNPFILFISVACILILVFYSDIRNRYVKYLPAPVWVLFVAIPLYYFFKYVTENININQWMLDDRFLVQLPEQLTENLLLPDFSRIDEPVFWLTVFLVTVVLSIESLAISKAVDKLDPYKRKTDLDKDLVGIGVATVISSMMGGLPVTTVIARSSVNINNGAKTSWSNFFHGVIVLIFIVAFAGFIQMIPLAALASILVYTGYMLASPKVFRKAYQQGWEQLAIVCVTVVAILSISLITGLFVGVIFTIVLHYFRSGMPLSLFARYTKSPMVKIVQEKKRTYLFKVKGIANFTNILQLQNKIKKVSPDTKIIMDFSHARLVDFTVLEYLHEHAEKYNRNGGEFHFTGLDVHMTSSHHPYALHVLKAPKPKKIRLTRRQNELNQLAKNKSWSYDPEIEWNVTDLQRFQFFISRPVEYQKNQLHGDNEMLGVNWKICDIALKNAFVAFEDYRLTIEVLTLPFEIPRFSMEEESLLDRMSLIAEHKDIDFDAYKNFSKKYLVQGPDEAAIRNLFSPSLVKFFERSEIYHLESNGKELLIFRHLRLTSPREIVRMVSYSEKLVEKLQEAALLKA